MLAAYRSRSLRRTPKSERDSAVAFVLFLTVIGIALVGVGLWLTFRR
jgi:hypothetical protein